MAVAAINLTTGTSAVNGPWTTASISPAAYKLILLTVSIRNGSSINPTAPSISGNGLTWVLVNSIVFDTTSTSRRTEFLFRAMGASPTTGAITITQAETETHAAWVVDQVSGVDTSGTNGSGAVVQSATNKDETTTATSLTVTLAAFTSSANATYGAFGSSGNVATTAGSGFTKLGDALESGSNISATAEFKNSNDTTVDLTWASSGDSFGGIAIEIRAEIIMFNVAGNSGDVAAASSYSGSATWNNNNRILTIDVSMLGPGVTVTAMTYGGAACTFIGSKSTVTSFGSVECWRILQSDSGAPAAGANTLAITLSGSIEFTAEWVSYTGVHQTSPTEGFNSAQATNTGSATDASVAITTVADNDWVHAAVVANDTSITAGNTTRNNISGTLGSGANEDNNGPKTPAGSVTMIYSGMGITTTWAIAGYALRDVNAASLAVATARLRSLLGVGL